MSCIMLLPAIVWTFLQATPVATSTVSDATPQAAPAAKSAQTYSADDARSAVQRAVKWLLTQQKADGSWGEGSIDSVQMMWPAVETHYAFKMGAHSLVCMALLVTDETPERRAALERGLNWLIDARIPKRGSEWDVDCSWSALYGFQAMVAAARDKRFAGPEWKPRIEKRGAELYELLEHNQEPLGGWGYYEGPVVSRRPTWSTSFATACVVPALCEARKMGWHVDAKVIEQAEKYLQGCALPTGAYQYDIHPMPRDPGESIDDVKGSLGRIQVCNWARRRAGDPLVTDEKIEAGLEAFFEHHKFLDVARLRPIPHEAYYHNAAYFYMFGHCYAGLVINELPRAKRAAFHERLRAQIMKTQWDEGSFLDFLNTSFMKLSGTSFAVLGLSAGLAQDKNEGSSGG